MKKVFIILLLVIAANVLNAQTPTKEGVNGSAITINPVYKPIAIRTLFLECNRLSGQKLSYRAFLNNPRLLTLPAGYKLEVIDCKFKAFKNFAKLYTLGGNAKEIKRLKTINN